MTLSPEQKQKVIATMAEMLVAELRAEMGGSFADLFCVDLAMASKMTGLSKPTLRGTLPIVELASGKHGIRVSVLHAHLAKKTVNPGQRGKKRRVA